MSIAPDEDLMDDIVSYFKPVYLAVMVYAAYMVIMFGLDSSLKPYVHIPVALATGMTAIVMVWNARLFLCIFFAVMTVYFIGWW